MDQNLKKMQDLLINEIINKQYSEDDFQGFAFERFPEKDELYKWNFDDLNQLVQQYQQLQNQKAGNQDQLNPQEQTINKIKIKIQKKMIKLRLTFRNKVDQFLKDQHLNQFLLIQQLRNKHNKRALAKFKYLKGEVLNLICKILLQAQENQIVFSEYEKQYECQKKRQYIEENVKLNFKVTTINTKKLIFTNQVFCIETQPFNWKVERSKEDFQTLEKIMLMYFPEYSGYILQYDQKQDFQLHLENALNIYYSKPKTRCLDYFVLFLNDNKANELHLKSFSHYTQSEKNIRKFQLPQVSTPSGQLKIEFSNKTYQGYKKLQKYQNQFLQNYKKFETKIQESQQIIYQEIEKMKYQLILLIDSNKGLFIQDEFAQKIPLFNLEIFYDQIYQAIQISNESKKYVSNTIESISKKISQTYKVLEQPLNKCSKNEQKLKTIYLNDFVSKKMPFLKDKEINDLLINQGLNSDSFSDYQYETISSIIRDVFPLKIDVNYEVLQKCKDEFAYLLQQVLLEAQISLSELFLDIKFTCQYNFNELTQAIKNKINSKQNI
ncbi:unnamed protein product (macronuclear) [Paramecium tetraurelia]|uniref:PX domain-containing protein n=1 Tax=Paramecium tetraurelia TaxID=5888 RepID=A0CPQ7_PARTE|nr:uncharacterized protein GSPATT00009166001 [Paramecium tetraurelia]CAK72774.1 unnamed protein product [Paramecium tetraurelia]|eukprot:XP_001440171.1 hypothetical protein (macronuclear) [Paramecium tetraurelia strain d4-2]